MTHDVALGLVGLGVAIAVLSAIGAIAVGGDPFNRLHFVTPVTSLAAPILAAGLCLEQGWGLAACEIILVVGLLFISGPIVSSATGRLTAQNRGAVRSESPE